MITPLPEITDTPAPPHPPFSFSNQTADTVKQIYPMTPGNACACPDCLAVSGYAKTIGLMNWIPSKIQRGNSIWDLDSHSRHREASTNLTIDTVRAILAVYIEDDLASRAAWRHVVSKFQEFAATHTAIWHPDDCPKGRYLVSCSEWRHGGRTCSFRLPCSRATLSPRSGSASSNRTFRFFSPGAGS